MYVLHTYSTCIHVLCIHTVYINYIISNYTSMSDIIIHVLYIVLHTCKYFLLHTVYMSFCLALIRTGKVVIQCKEEVVFRVSVSKRRFIHV